MIDEIKFSNYKVFKKQQTLELKPITVLIGKNSSGKSAILKLFTLIEGSLSGDFQEPLRLTNNGIELGEEFRDLVYAREYARPLELVLKNATDNLEISIGSANVANTPEIWAYTLNDNDLDPSKENFHGFWAILQPKNTLSISTNYISSYREGLVRYFEGNKKSYDYVGVKGEYVYSILIEDALTTPKKLIQNVAKFYRENFEGWGLRVNQDKAPAYQIELEKNKLKINLKEVGLGMVQALPLVVSALMPTKKPTLIIIEEPELHLHPAAHGNLAQLFAESSNNDKNKRYLIETHSQNFVLRLRRLIAEGKLNKEQVLIYYADFDEETSESTLTKIIIDELGKPRNVDGEIYWPDNVFSETLDETSAIRSAQLNKQNYDR